MQPKHVTIIGAGQAAAQLVAALHSERFDGEIRLIGDEPHLPYQRPPLSKAFLKGEVGIETVTLRPAEFYAQHRTELITGLAATAIDRNAQTVTLADGRRFDYEALVIATGTRARQLPVPGAKLAGILTLRTIEDALTLQAGLKPGRRIVIIGGGYIGLEVAASARKLGASVTVIEALDRLMARVASPEMSAYFLEVHRNNGVDVRLSTAVEGFRGSGRSGVEAVLARGGAVEADLVLVGIGAVPNVELAQQAGLAVDNGILVDAQMRTSDPAILAIGDCCNHPSRFTGGRLRLESVQGAIDQANTAAKTLTGVETAYDKVPWFWSDQYDEKLQIAGLPQPGDETIVRRHDDPRPFAVFHLRAGRLTAVEAVNAARDYMTGRRIMEAGGKVRRELLSDPKAGVKELMA
jgi:3-phenylpropionate/trans-cinnamate dioxygenase ferredoxin reductase subunit